MMNKQLLCINHPINIIIKNLNQVLLLLLHVT